MRDAGDSPAIFDPDAAQHVYQAEAALLELARAYSAETEHHKLGAHSALSADDRYRALVEQIPAVVFLAQMEGGLGEAYVSPQIESILGFSQEEWLGNPIL
jgi:PAS domain-containing protein